MSATLDTTLTPELIAEGFYNEVAHKIQAMRGELNLSPKDRIIASVEVPSELFAWMAKNKKKLKRVVGAKKISYTETVAIKSSIDFNGASVAIGIKKHERI
jgi:hypothetical protein